MDSANRSGKSTRHFQFPNIKENVLNTLQSTEYDVMQQKKPTFPHIKENVFNTLQSTEHDVMQQKKPTFPHIKEMYLTLFRVLSMMLYTRRNRHFHILNRCVSVFSSDPP